MNKPRRRFGAVTFLCLSAGVFSLLIWAKLRVVTGIPRTAYAEPENAAVPARRAQAAATPTAPKPGATAKADRSQTE